MDRRPVPQVKFCGLHTIAELEKLLGFGAGARVILRIIEHCQGSNDGCTAPFHCPERLAMRCGGTDADLSPPPRIGATGAPAPRVEPAPRSAEVVPLDLARGQTLRDDHGNAVERRLLGIDVALARGDALAELVQYWRALADGGTTPTFSDLDPIRLAQLGLLGRLHVLNADNADPAKMRFDLYGNKVPLDNGRIYTGLAVGDHPIRIFAQSVAADYDAVRRAAEPRYFRLRKRLGGVGYRYARLVLPFSTGNGRIDRLVVAIRPEPDDGIALNG